MKCAGAEELKGEEKWVRWLDAREKGGKDESSKLGEEEKKKE